MIYRGDCLEVLKTFEADSIDAIVTDPPYGWRFMGKAWDSTFAVAVNGPEAFQLIEKELEYFEIAEKRIAHAVENSTPAQANLI